MMHLIVMAKAPLPGRVKTRLCPPLQPAEAAELALASLLDTLDAVSASRAARRVLALDGPPGTWLPAGFDLVPQRGVGLGERLANAWTDVGGPGVLIGMDTPQVTAQLLDDAMDQLAADDRASVLGLATDGGWWAIGLHQSDPAVFTGLTLSTSDAGSAQFERLDRLGLRPTLLGSLRDVDTWVDAEAVATEATGTRFAATVHELSGRLASRAADVRKAAQR